MAPQNWSGVQQLFANFANCSDLTPTESPPDNTSEFAELVTNGRY